MDKKDLIPLSASRIKTAQNCSWTYFCKYVLKLPDTSNEGASKGWICHLIFELLGDDKHKKHLKKVLKNRSVYSSVALKRLVEIHANKLGVNYKGALVDMDKMILKGLNYDFFGDILEKPLQAISEQDFDLIVDEKDKKYRIKGFIDKLFIYKDTALIRDFKTSKEVFKGKEITDNLQDLMYSLAVQKMFPKQKNRNCEFLFLRFPLDKDLTGNHGKGVLKMDSISDEELEGFEYHLTEISNYLNDFSETKALSNLAAKKPYPSDGSFGGPLSCGREGFKKSHGEFILDENGNKIPSYICPFRKPMSYYALVDEDGKIKKTAFLKDKDSLVKLKEKNDQIIKEEYSGCPHWNKKDEFDI